LSAHRLTLRHPQGETVLQIGRGLASALPKDLDDLLTGRTVFQLSTPTLRRLHGEKVARLVASAGRVIELEAPDGEPAKTLAVAGELWQQMLASGGKRDSVLVAIGGGSLTDLGGFLAGCFLRGIDVVHVPTTLLAMVDAAIGGKTAIDLPQGKNTVGVFHHPVYFLADSELLATLPVEELRSGLVEAFKMAAMLDGELFVRIEYELDALLAGDIEALTRVIGGAAAAKAKVVQEDPDEQDLRKVLNFGHTLGHAVEGVLGFSGLRHGEAIAYGMLFTLGLQRGQPQADAAFLGRVREVLRRMQLPALPLGREHAEALVDFMSRDKKASEKGLVWVLPTQLGEHEFRADISWQRIRGELPAFLADPWAYSRV